MHTGCPVLNGTKRTATKYVLNQPKTWCISLARAAPAAGPGSESGPGIQLLNVALAEKQRQRCSVSPFSQVVDGAVHVRAGALSQLAAICSAGKLLGCLHTSC